jgi:hypothetical protein
MNNEERRRALLAEQSDLKAMLGDAPGESLSKLSLERKLADVERELAAIESAPTGRRVRAALVFDGDPVFGARSIDAEFAGRMLVSAQHIVAAIHAQRAKGKLGKSGTFPDSRNARLAVSGTLHGSFGFYLEETQAALFESPGSAALVRLLALLGAAQRSNEAFSAAVAETDPRVLRHLRLFLKRAETAGATFRITTDGGGVAFSSEDVRQASARATAVRVTEIQQHWPGTLTGVFAEARRFEFVPDDRAVIDGDKIEGSLSDDVDPHYLKRHYLKRCLAHIQETQTRSPAGQFLRRYLLWATEDLRK